MWGLGALRIVNEPQVACSFMSRYTGHLRRRGGQSLRCMMREVGEWSIGVRRVWRFRGWEVWVGVQRSFVAGRE